jgi:hypothetical protein
VTYVPSDLRICPTGTERELGELPALWTVRPAIPPHKIGRNADAVSCGWVHHIVVR